MTKQRSIKTLNRIEKAKRYKKAMQAALNIQQLDYLRARLLAQVSKNLTAFELHRREFDQEAAFLAISRLSLNEKIRFIPTSGVKCKLKFKSVDLYLHGNPDKLEDSRQIMEKILEEINTAQVSKARW